MNANDEYEELARQFKKDTGLLAPGKDAPSAVGGDPDYNPTHRREEWDKWMEKRRDKPTMYVALMLEDFDMECVSHRHLPVQVDVGKLAGYLPVYLTLVDLREDYPDADYACIRDAQMVARQEEL